ncbi:hypothetical protein [Engelhardtia mirabilis]|uniref:Uncharacterized protein n=1 Tax=Engelhardtia mirabilis TaxID=2528011 RepID=A0A518BF67_9BACT|nr:hypothetical protein Pla133_06930 [Planctomycetes bacterium Pla133]QDU99953.1 hypothetical protein Pla86_06920 [Planctomycetes bacterium Pla86]
MIYHDRELPVVLPRRGAVFTLEGLTMLAGALGGAFLESSVDRLVAGALALVLALPSLWIARRFAAMGSARRWRQGLVLGVAVCLGVGVAMGGPALAMLGVFASLLLGEAGAVAATAAPWPRELAGWRPVFVVSVRLFGVVSAAVSVGSSPFTGMAAGALAAVVVMLMALPWMFPAPDEVVVEGARVPARRGPCPRCGVPVDWPRTRAGSCSACGLVQRHPG